MPANRFFIDLRLKPNYFPLCSGHLKNLHMLTVSSTGRFTRIGRRFSAAKLNFYSTFEYRLPGPRNGYSCPLSTATLLTNINGLRTFGSKATIANILSSLRSIEEKCKTTNSGTCPYRLEFRCKFSRARKVLKRLKRHANKRNFDYARSSEVFNVLQQNINKFCHAISNSAIDGFHTPETIFESILLEMIMRKIYLAGAGKISLLSNDQNAELEMQLGSDPLGFAVLNDVK